MIFVRRSDALGHCDEPGKQEYCNPFSNTEGTECVLTRRQRRLREKVKGDVRHVHLEALLRITVSKITPIRDYQYTYKYRVIQTIRYMGWEVG